MLASLKFRDFCQFMKNTTIVTQENEYEYRVQKLKGVFNFIDVKSLTHTNFQYSERSNRTEWSPIRSVIIQVITKSDDRAAGV